MRTIGILTTGSADAERKRFDDFGRGLADLGYVEGRNLRIERRYADGQFERLPVLAADLVGRKVAVIMCMSTIATQAARRATSTVPIVFASIADPVAEGFAASLARPGGNVTGVSTAGTELAGKQLQTLKDAFPAAARVAVFTAPQAPHAAAQMAELETAARSLGVALDASRLRERKDFEPTLQRLRQWRADAIYVMQGAENSAVRDLLVEFARIARLPAIYPQRIYAEAGGLMSYGANFDANYYRAAAYVDRILKGADPGALPIEQPRQFELVINLATASALGLTLPPGVLMRADRVLR